MSEQPAIPGINVIGLVGDEHDRFYTPPALAAVCAEEVRRFGQEHWNLHRDPDLMQFDEHLRSHMQPRPMLRVFDPAVGGGAFPIAMRNEFTGKGTFIGGMDIDPDARGLHHVDGEVGDFTKGSESEHLGWDVVITNPPFKHAHVVIDYVERGLRMAPIVAYILPWAGFGGVDAWAPIMSGEGRPRLVRPITPRPWGKHVRETALFIWTRPGWTGRTEVAPLPRWKL